MRRALLSLAAWVVLASTTLAAAPKASLKGPDTLPAGGTLVLDARSSVSDKPLEWRVRGPDLVLLSLDSGGRQGVIAMAMNVPAGPEGKPVVYRFLLIARGKPEPSAELDVDVDVLDVTVSGKTPVPPGPPPGPGPPPPGPGPGPPTPAPIPEPGLHVLMVYESSSPLTAGQQTVIYGQTVRDYLRRKCPPESGGSPWAGFRIYDQHVDLSGESKVWQEAMRRPRSSLPWIIVSDPAKGGYEGPLPGSVDEAMALLKKFGGE